MKFTALAALSGLAGSCRVAQAMQEVAIYGSISGHCHRQKKRTWIFEVAAISFSILNTYSRLHLNSYIQFLFFKGFHQIVYAPVSTKPEDPRVSHVFQECVCWILHTVSQ